MKNQETAMCGGLGDGRGEEKALCGECGCRRVQGDTQDWGLKRWEGSGVSPGVGNERWEQENIHM